MAITVLGPYSPKEFSDLTTLNNLIGGTPTEAGKNSPGSEKSAEPIMVLGNIYIVVTT